MALHCRQPWRSVPFLDNIKALVGMQTGRDGLLQGWKSRVLLRVSFHINDYTQCPRQTIRVRHPAHSHIEGLCPGVSVKIRLRNQSIVLITAIAIDDDGIVADSVQSGQCCASLGLETARPTREAGGGTFGLIQQKSQVTRTQTTAELQVRGEVTRYSSGDVISHTAVQVGQCQSVSQSVILIWYAAAVSISSCAWTPHSAASPATLHNPTAAPAFSNVNSRSRYTVMN